MVSAFIRATAAAAIIASVAVPAAAMSITIGAIKDATIFQNNPNNSNGAGPAMFAGTNGMNSPRRGLLEFDIAASIPAGSIINSVQLELFLAQVAGGSDPTPRSIELHRLTDDWGQGVTGMGSTVGGSGQGFPGNIGDATWNERFCGSTPCNGVSGTLWTTAGGDFAAAASASTLVGSVINAPYFWLTTPTLVSDVQGWLNTPATNFGWALINAQETVSTDFRAFYTRDFTDNTLVPELTIDFTAPTAAVPEPGTIGLIGIGLVRLVATRRRRATRARKRPRDLPPNDHRSVIG